MVWADAQPLYRKSIPPNLPAKQRNAFLRGVMAAGELHDALFPED